MVHEHSWCAAHNDLPSGTAELSGNRCRGRLASTYSLVTEGEFEMSAFGVLRDSKNTTMRP